MRAHCTTPGHENRVALAHGLCGACYQRARGKGLIPERQKREGCAFSGPWPRVRLRLTPEDVLGQRGSAHGDS